MSIACDRFVNYRPRYDRHAIESGRGCPPQPSRQLAATGEVQTKLLRDVVPVADGTSAYCRRRRVATVPI